MAASGNSRLPAADLSTGGKAPTIDQKPLWNQDTVRDVAESVGLLRDPVVKMKVG